MVGETAPAEFLPIMQLFKTQKSCQEKKDDNMYHEHTVVLNKG